MQTGVSIPSHKLEKSGADELELCTPTSKKVSHAGVASEESSKNLGGTVDTLHWNLMDGLSKQQKRWRWNYQLKI